MTPLELYKTLNEDKPSDTLRQKEDELFELIPELGDCKGFDQHTIWHPYDVYEHTLRVVDYVPKNNYLRVAALFHDVGKSIVYKKTGSFKNHWVDSIEVFNNFMKKHNIDDPLSTYVKYLIYYHDLPANLIPDSVVFLFGVEGIQRLYEFKEADLRAQNPDFYEETMQRYEVEKQGLFVRCRK